MAACSREYTVVVHAEGQLRVQPLHHYDRFFNFVHS